MGLLSKLKIMTRADSSAAISAEELQGMLDRLEVITILDVRNTSKFCCEHIAGAVNVPLKLIKKHDDVLIGVLESKNRLIVVCCEDGSDCWAARDILLARGATKVACLKDGMRQWVREGRMVISD